MTIPADATKVNFDASGDDPRAARSEFVTWIDGYNALLAHARAAPFFANSYTVGEGVEINAAALRVKIRAAWGIARDGNGLALDILNMAAMPSDVDPNVDNLAIYDASGGVNYKIVSANVLKSFKDLTQLTSVDGAADKVPVYDASAAALKWAYASAVGGGLLLGGVVDTASAAASQQVSGLAAKSARHIVFFGKIYPATNGVTLDVKLLKADGTTLAVATTAAVDNSGGGLGCQIFGVATQALDGGYKGIALNYICTGGASWAHNRGTDVSVVDQVQVVASSGNVSGNLHVLYTT